MNPTVFTKAAMFTMLAALLQAAAGTLEVLAGAKMKLFVNDVDPGEAAVIGDFTLASFTGSAAITIAAWGEAFTGQGGYPTTIGTLGQWDYDSGDAETVYGVVLTDNADGLLAYARLTEPKTMDDTSDSLIVVPRMVVSPTGFGTFDRLAA